MPKFNVERSREIRQWIGLGIKTVTTGAMLDYWFNDGEIVKRIFGKAKAKVDEIKAKKAAREEQKLTEKATDIYYF